MNYDAVIVASGKGERANLGYNKTFYKMKDNKSVLMHSVDLFCSDPDCKKVVVVTNEEYFDQIPSDEKIVVTKGGLLRKDSVYNGLKRTESDYVLIHDGARPFLHVVESKAVISGRYAIDTIKIVKDGVIEKTIDRKTVFMAETPQAFARELIMKCYENCEDIEFTDDASLAESLGYKVAVVADAYNNRKLTKEEDFKDL